MIVTTGREKVGLDVNGVLKDTVVNVYEKSWRCRRNTGMVVALRRDHS